MGGGGGGSGGSTQITPRDPSQEKGTINNWYQNQQDQLNSYVQNQPLLNAANTGALNFWQNLPSLTGPLQSLFSNLPSITPTLQGLQTQFGGLPQQLQQQFGGLPHDLQQQFGGLSGQLQNQFGGLPHQLTQSAMPLRNTMQGYLQNVIQNQGALSPEASRDVSQQTRELASQYGTGRQLGTLGTELLNRQSTREGRYNTALGQYEGASGQVGALDQLAQSLGTNLAQTRFGIGSGLAQAEQGLGTGLAQARQGLGTNLAQVNEGLQGQDLAQRMGLAGGIQGLQSGGLNQLTGTQGANVSSFTGLENPILSYLSNLYQGNLQASISQAGINQQGNLASAGQKGGMTSGIISGLGSVLGAVALSDERVKTKIRATGEKTAEGIPLKTFEFKTRPGVRFLGPMAQDVEKRLPGRVITEPKSGVKMVIGFPMIEVSPIKRKAA